MLDPIEKLLFVYLLTNEHTNISGIYEMPLKIMAVETGLDESMLKKVFGRLKSKVNYVDGRVIIKNFIKHQETGSPNVRKGILNCLEELNKDFLKDVVNKGIYVLPIYYIDTLCIPYVEGRNYLDLDLDSNLDLDSTELPQKSSKKKIEKELFGELENVKLTNEEYQKLIDKFGDKNTNILIFELDTYIGSKGDKYKSHYATLLNWAKRKWEQQEEKKIIKNNNIAFT